jgi:TetR/AcrR family transcriptional regulator
MGIAERKKKEKEERRNQILGVAKALIRDRGVLAISMQDIADEAELSKATIYLYFQSKEAILSEILQTSVAAFIAYTEERLESATDGLRAIRILWESYLGFFVESPDIFIFICTGIKNYIPPSLPIASEESEIEQLHPEWKIRRLIAKVLKRGCDDGTLEASIDPDRIARIVVMITTAIIDNIARLPREERDVKLIREDMQNTFEILLRGLAASSTKRSHLGLGADRDPEAPLRP